MSSISHLSSINSYLLSGSINWPDVVTVFIKDASGQIQMKDEQTYNELSHHPLEFMNAFRKIKAAAEVIFKEIEARIIFNENSQFSIALKNLGRGSIQLIPLVGMLL